MSYVARIRSFFGIKLKNRKNPNALNEQQASEVADKVFEILNRNLQGQGGKKP